jgi:hypothetical protein
MLLACRRHCSLARTVVLQPAREEGRCHPRLGAAGRPRLGATDRRRRHLGVTAAAPRRRLPSPVPGSRLSLIYNNFTVVDLLFSYSGLSVSIEKITHILNIEIINTNTYLAT